MTFTTKKLTDASPEEWDNARKQYIQKIHTRIPEERPQVGGTHYKECSIEPIDYILANSLGFCEGNVVKYISRWRHKNGIEDLKKAKQYIDFLIEEAEALSEGRTT